LYVAFQIFLIRTIIFSKEPSFIYTYLYLDNLPDETHKKIRASLNEILGSDVHHVTPDSLGGVDAEDLVLHDAERVELGLVDHTLVDCLGYGVVDQLAVTQKLTIVYYHYILIHYTLSPYTLNLLHLPCSATYKPRTIKD
jgi:hypothetical protein